MPLVGALGSAESPTCSQELPVFSSTTPTQPATWPFRTSRAPACEIVALTPSVAERPSKPAYAYVPLPQIAAARAGDAVKAQAAAANRAAAIGRARAEISMGKKPRVVHRRRTAPGQPSVRGTRLHFHPWRR